MAEIGEILPNEENVDAWYIGARTRDTAEAYVRYLHRHSRFGGHVGLPQQIRNKEDNKSLKASSGVYDMLDVYSLSGTILQAGTVVNFITDDVHNPLGETRVYPVTDISKPIGYMITQAEPDVLGVCVLSGVLEVPLLYAKGSSDSTFVKKDYVEYDIENGAFKFSDSGYPVFNIYQDVDGDWIAIILFGNDTVSEYVYDGPFAVSVAHIDSVIPNKLWINCKAGDVLFNDVKGTCPGVSYTVPSSFETDTSVGNISVSIGQSLWLQTFISGNTHSYNFISQATTPIDGSTVFYTKIAENMDGSLRQIQYGNIRYSRTRIIAGQNVVISPPNGLGDVTISAQGDVFGGTGGSEFYVPPYYELSAFSGDVPDGRLGISFVREVKGGTVGFWDEGGGAVGVYTSKDGSVTQVLTNKVAYNAPSDGWLRISVIDGGTSSGECLSFFSSTGGIPLYKYGSFGDKNIELIAGDGISITGETSASTGLATGNKIISLDSSLSLTLSGNTASIGITGSTSTISISGSTNITIGSNGNNSITITASDDIGTFEGTDDIGVVGDTTSIVGTIQDLILSVNSNSASINITNSPSSVNIVGGTNVVIEPGVQNDTFIIGATFSETPHTLSTSVSNGIASISISGGTDSIKLIKGSGIKIEAGSFNEIVIGSTATVTGLTHSVSTNSATVSTVGGSGSVVFVGAGNTTISTNSSNQIIVGSTASSFTETPQDLSVDVNDGTATISLSDSSSTVNITGGTNVYIKEVAGEVIIDATIDGLTYSVSGDTASIYLIDAPSNKVEIVGSTNVSIEDEDGQILISSTDTNAGVSGITSTVNTTTHKATVSTIGGSGNVVFVGAGGTTISTNTNNEIVIGSTVASSGSSGSSSEFIMNPDVYLLTESSKKIICCLNPSSDIYTDVYSSLASALGTNPEGSSADYDDVGSVVLALPQNPQSGCFLDVIVPEECATTVIASVDGRLILDTSGGSQGFNTGVFTDYLVTRQHYLYVYITDISNWSVRTGYSLEEKIQECISSIKGGCWLRYVLS